MTITYDDPFNLRDPRSFRASLGFLLKDYDAALIEKFKKLHYEWRQLPSVKALAADFPYRNAASLTYGSTRFLPTCFTYLMRHQRRLKNVFQEKSGTIEVLEGKTINYYLVMEKQKEFSLSTKDQPALKNDNKFTSVYYKKNE